MKSVNYRTSSCPLVIGSQTHVNTGSEHGQSFSPPHITETAHTDVKMHLKNVLFKEATVMYNLQNNTQQYVTACG